MCVGADTVVHQRNIPIQGNTAPLADPASDSLGNSQEVLMAAMAANGVRRLISPQGEDALAVNST